MSRLDRKPLHRCLTLAAALSLGACTGEMGGSVDRPDSPDGTPGVGGRGGRPGTGGSGATGMTPDGKPLPPGSPASPAGSCATGVPTRITRLSDRHLANAIRDLLALDKRPEIETGSGTNEAFLPNKAASITGAVSLSLREAVETAAAEATAVGKPAVKCAATELDCARAFIDRVAGRAFRRAVTTDERDKLLAVYNAGKDAYGGHAGGIRLTIEAILQSPSFLYQTEIGTPAGMKRKLSSYELASKISFFLRDSVPDDELWNAAASGKLATKEGVSAEVERLMKLPEVKANISKMLVRLFQLDRIYSVTKAPEIKDYNPALADTMYKETVRFIDDVLWKGGGKLSDLLTSRKAFVDKSLAAIYGVRPPTTAGLTEVTLPENQRAGILTQASILTMEAQPAESSVVHRGVFIARELLCFFPPPPAPSDLEAGEALKKAEPTERGRAEKRMALERCGGCHSAFDPLGIAFENYDTLGRYRTTIPTPAGAVPVNASWNYDIYDLKGQVSSGVELSKRLAASKAVRECMVRQFASYAIGQRLDEDQACTTGDIAAKFDASGGSFVDLVTQVATWDGLGIRQEGVSR